MRDYNFHRHKPQQYKSKWRDIVEVVAEGVGFASLVGLGIFAVLIFGA